MKTSKTCSRSYVLLTYIRKRVDGFGFFFCMNHSEIPSNDGRKQESGDRIIQGQCLRVLQSAAVLSLEKLHLSDLWPGYLGQDTKELYHPFQHLLKGVS